MIFPRPDSEPSAETKEFALLLNMLTAAFEERYEDAGKTSFFLDLCLDTNLCDLKGASLSHKNKKYDNNRSFFDIFVYRPVLYIDIIVISTN